jgi:protein dithiol oxidoreductase (disulfide-forming)
MNRIALGLVALITAGMAFAQAKPTPVAGTDYIVLETPQPTSTGNNVEVLEFFSYGCIHCHEFVPYIDAWEKKMPKGVEFVLMPAIFGNPSWEALACAFYTGEVLGVPKTKTHLPIFKRNFAEGKPPMSSLDELGVFFEQNFGVKNATFQQTAMSFAVETKIRRADDMSRRYRIAGTPTMIVAGKYVVNVGKTGLQGVIDTVEYLVAKELAAKKAAPPAKKAA